MANDKKVEPEMGDPSKVDHSQPTIQRLNIGTSSGSNDDWLKYLLAFNNTSAGSLAAFVIGFFLAAVIFGPLGYYIKWKDVRNQTSEITQQAAENEAINAKALAAEQNRNATTNESLKQLGYSDEDIAFITGGEEDKFSVLKDKFTKVIPGETITKYLPGKTVYVPRTDCDDDYLGNESAGSGNDIIDNGFRNRASQQ